MIRIYCQWTRLVAANAVMEFDVLASLLGYSSFVHEDFEDYYHLVVREYFFNI